VSAANDGSRERSPRLVVGRVRGFHGLKGTVRLESLTDRAEERFAAGRSLFVEGSDEPLTIAEAEPDRLGWRVRFVELSDRNAAESIRDAYLEAVVGPGEQPDRGQFYWHEVIGARVVDTDDVALGEVVDMYRAGGGEVAVVRGPAGELDIPLVRPVVRVYAPARGEIVVDVDALGLADEPVGDDSTAGSPRASKRAESDEAAE
jgi:16S rRNA processing protein RimM